jgi:DNA invertase Pin-like site-specific DNA recombinase
MSRSNHYKLTASHLRRDAYLYVRQATTSQGVECQDFGRQYALRERAVALGWPVERVHVIDSDMGKSGWSSAEREGFRMLVDEIGRGRAGLVLSMDVWRLTRSCTEWNRLLKICAVTDTLVLVEDGIYSPGDLEQRLLLGCNVATVDSHPQPRRVRREDDVYEVPT